MICLAPHARPPLLAGPLPRPSVATTPPLGWITAEPSRPGRKFSLQYGPGFYLFHISARPFPGSLRQTAGHTAGLKAAQQCSPGGHSSTGLLAHPHRVVSGLMAAIEG